MPRIITSHKLLPTTGKKEPIRDDEFVMVLLKEFYIGDNREWWINGAEVNISFEFSTGTNVSVGKIFSTFREVPDHEKLPLKNVILLPPTQVKDHFSITLNAVELDQHEATRVKSILDTAGKVIDKVLDKVPLPGANVVGSLVTGIIADIVNLIASLNDDDIIIREIATYIVDETKYPGFAEDQYLGVGDITILEDMSKEEKVLFSKIARYSKETSDVIKPFIKPDKDRSYAKLQVVKAPAREPKPKPA
jgi:hypothetical protein